MTTVDRVAEALLYEGYILWPYRRSARKNQQRWTLAGVYPRSFSEATGGSDPWRVQTQCLVLSDGARPTVDVRVRFLHVVVRRVARFRRDGSTEYVDELRTGSEQYLAWEEAREREIVGSDLPLDHLLQRPRRIPIGVAEGRDEEVLIDPDGKRIGALVREWRALEGEMEVTADQIEAGVFRLTVVIANTGSVQDLRRDSAQRQSFASTHTILTVRDGQFVSLLDPPDDLQQMAAACTNIGTWPVLAGDHGDRHTLLSSPIILYDYPRVAPESRGDLFDAGEIDQLLALNILALTDAEKDEMRATDPRVREILDRTEAFGADDFVALHGTIRDLRYLRADSMELPAPRAVTVNDIELCRGSRVRLHPRSGRDIMDLALTGKVAIVESIEHDYDDRLHVAVTVEDDPGRDLGEARMIGHRFFFAPDELEPLDGVAGDP